MYMDVCTYMDIDITAYIHMRIYVCDRSIFFAVYLGTVRYITLRVYIYDTYVCVHVYMYIYMVFIFHAYMHGQ